MLFNINKKEMTGKGFNLLKPLVGHYFFGNSYFI